MSQYMIRRLLQALPVLLIVTFLVFALMLAIPEGETRPDLFLMDMYFPEGATDAQNPLKELNEARCQLLKAETRFYEVLARLRQTAEGGFREARKARERF